jgi:hypothetical protein
MNKDRKRKLAELRKLIEEGDRGLAEGRVTKYRSDELAADVIARGCIRRKRESSIDDKHPEQSIELQSHKQCVESDAAMDELVRQAQELDMGY